MNGAVQPVIDIGAEAGISPLEAFMVAAIIALAVAYLARGYLRRGRKAASGEGCTGCPGCSATGGCPSRTHFAFDPDKPGD